MAKIITLISPIPGVGKTHFGVNLAHRLTSLNQSACLFSADPDTSTLYGLMGVRPKYCLDDLIRNRHTIDHILSRGSAGIDVFPGVPGLEHVAGLTDDDQDRLFRSFRELNLYDYFILDTIPGLSRNVVAFSKTASTVILVMTPDAAVLTDAYLLLKALAANGLEAPVAVLINKCKNAKAARSAYLKFKEAVETYLSLKVQPLGSIFFDPHVEKTDTIEKPFLIRFPKSDAARCVDNIARHIMDKRIADIAVSAFWTHFLKKMKQPYRIVAERPVSSHDPEPQEISRGDQTETEPLPPPDPCESVDPMEPAEDPAQETRVMAQIASLSREIEAVKQSIQFQEAVAGESIDSVSAETPVIRIPLDFEGYVKRRNMER